jgi:hypothetical protein
VRYGLPDNGGPLSKQLGMVHRTILRLAFPGGKPRPKPGPYRGDHAAKQASDGQRRFERTGPDGSGAEQRSEGVRVSMPSGDAD